jgi:hypothetical protein
MFARDTDPALLASGTALRSTRCCERARQAGTAGRGRRGLDLDTARRSFGWHINGDLDDETGEMFATHYAAAGPPIRRRRRHQQHADGQSERSTTRTLPPHQWPDPTQPPPRVQRQPRHDAFTRGSRRCSTAALSGARQAGPHVAVTVGLDFVRRPAARPARTTRGTVSRGQRSPPLLAAARSSLLRLVLDADTGVARRATL